MKWLKPGKTNKEDRMNFVEFWVDYIRTHSDREWSRQQKVLIDSQVKNAKKQLIKLISVKDYLEIKEIEKRIRSSIK